MAPEDVSPRLNAAAWTSESFANYLMTETPPFVANLLEHLKGLKKAEKSIAWGPCDLPSVQKMQIENAVNWTLDHVCYRCEEQVEYECLVNNVLPQLGLPVCTFAVFT
jgi:hypothetical protein